jgi:dipeptidyl aminopeptidase/acylaminoacyl peptidase
MLLPLASGAQDTAARDDELTLELIMSDPDWLGRQPQRPFWADDSGSVYFLQKREGSRLNDLFVVDLEGVLRQVEHQDMGVVDVDGGDLSTDGRKVYERQGDLYLKDLERGEIRQLTRTAERESSPRFLLGDRQITFMRGDTVLVRDLTTGLEFQPADLRLADDPDEEEEEDDYLNEQQTRLFEIVRLDEERKEAHEDEEQAEQEADLTRPPLPFYLGEKLQIRQASLSPDGRLMLVVLNEEEIDRGKRDSMPNYVTASGYVESREVRSKVGTGKPETDQLVLLDLQTHERHDLDLSVLPEIASDPLAEVREANAADEEEDDDAPAEGDDEATESDDETEEDTEDPAPRPVSIWTIEWTDDGSQAAFQAHSADNKDRWIATVDLGAREVVPQHHLRDSAWINWRYNDFGWLPDGATLWYLSEETGYSHLYLRTLGQQPRALTSGEYEVSSPHVTRDGDAIFYVANDLHPGRYEVHRFNLRGGESDRLTDLGGMNRFVLSPDEQSLLLTHSTTTSPPDLWIQSAAIGGEARRLTSTASDAFLGKAWIDPDIVPIPSAHHDRPIYSRVYDAVGSTPLEGSDKRPAVIFIHGAGYLQNAHLGWYVPQPARPPRLRGSRHGLPRLGRLRP